MFMLDYITPEKAEGDIEKIYSRFPEEIPVPEPLQLYSASPRYLLKQMSIVDDLMQDEAYEPGLLAAIRYIGATKSCFGFCTVFNRQMLTSMGLTEEEVDALTTTPSKSFEAKEAAILTFVSKSISDPDAIDQEDVDRVRSQGWTDQQIFECTAYAQQMISGGNVFRTFAKK